jgi:hypothetical protein
LPWNELRQLLLASVSTQNSERIRQLTFKTYLLVISGPTKMNSETRTPATQERKHMTILSAGLRRKYANVSSPILPHYPSSCLLFKTQRFGEWILSPSSGGTYSVGPNRWICSLSPDSPVSVSGERERERLPISVGPNWVVTTWRRGQNTVSETLCFK